MRKYLFLVSLVVACCATACSDKDAGALPEPQPAAPGTIRIFPTLLTRVTDTHFETDDAIGVTVRRSSGETYLDNRQFTFDGTQFTAESVVWYDQTAETATLIACYPYRPDGLPESFSIQADQRGAGFPASNLIGACSKGVTPSEEAVSMTFRHLMARIAVEVEAEADCTVEELLLCGVQPTVAVDWEQQTVGAASGEAVEVSVYEQTANSAYLALIPPQTAALQVRLTTDRSTATKQLVSMEFQQGKSYTLQLHIDEQGELNLVVKGDIVGWEEGGTLGEAPESKGDEDTAGDDAGTSDDANGELVYEGVHYRTQTVAGQCWMAENLRYQPSGDKAFYYPAANNDPQADVERLGLLYPYQTALAGSPEGTEPLQGICPEGWRLPTISELETLAASVGRTFFTESGYCMVSSITYVQEQSFIMSSTLVSDRLSYLYLDGSGSAPQSVTRPKGNLATSVRCVKEQ